MRTQLIRSHFLDFIKCFQNPSTRPFATIKDKVSASSVSRRIVGHDIDLNGQKIHFKTAGWGPKNVLLMPGALGTSSTDFSVQLNELDVSKFSLVAWDPPGHGESRGIVGNHPQEKKVQNFYWKDAQKAAELMEYLSIKRYSVLGWSDGGITAIILAASNDKVEKLVIWGASAYLAKDDYEAVSKIRDVEKTWSKKFRRNFEPIYGKEGLQLLWGNLVDYYLSLKDICISDLSNIKAETLILHGDQDPLVAPEHPDFLLKKIPNATLKRFEDGKHDIHMNRRSSAEFNQIVEDFLSK